MPTTQGFSDLRGTPPGEIRRVPSASTRRRAGHSKNTPSYRFAERRQALGLTQTELADLIGKSQSAVSQIETGDIGLSLDVLRAIVAQLGGSLEVSAIFEDRRVTIEA